MRISLTVPNNHRVRTLLQPWQDEVGGRQIGQVAALADRLGFSRLTVGEHFLMPKDHVEVSGAHYVDAPTAIPGTCSSWSTSSAGSGILA